MDTRYIFREVNPEYMDTRDYFWGDTFTENAGDFNYCLFPVFDGNCNNLNAETFKEITREYDSISYEYSNIADGGYYRNIKELMIDYKLHYSPRAAHALRLLIENEYKYNQADILADYLAIKTGQKWNVKTISGYCQGDYVDMVYCEKRYTEKDIETIGEIYLGCCKEFTAIELDAAGNEIDSCGGYFVADSEIDYKDIDGSYKRIMCDYIGIDIQAATLELFDGYSRTAIYRTV